MAKVLNSRWRTRAVFSIRQLSVTKLTSQLEAARTLGYSYSTLLNTALGLNKIRVPAGFVLDHTHSTIGRGPESFGLAKQALKGWKQFDLGWVRVINPDAKIEVGETVGVEAYALGLWSVNFSRILYVIDEPTRFGFGYGTTSLHVERGEERFLLEYDPQSDCVDYDLLAVSQAAYWLAKLGNPYTRSQQRRFARESHLRIKQLAQPS